MTGRCDVDEDGSGWLVSSNHESRLQFEHT